MNADPSIGRTAISEVLIRLSGCQMKNLRFSAFICGKPAFVILPVPRASVVGFARKNLFLPELQR